MHPRSWSARRVATLCAGWLCAGAIVVLTAPPPWHLLGVAVAHGAAWGLAWAGQLWAPDRRSRQSASPLRAAVGYAALTRAFGVLVDRFGAAGVIATHAALGLLAALARLAAGWRRAPASAPEHRTLPR